MPHVRSSFQLTEEDEELLYNPHWYAVHTKSRHEKVSATLIAAKGIEVYLPLRRLKSNWSDRVKLIETPLFKGYFFVRIALEDKRCVLHNKGIVRLVGTISPEPIPAEQVESLKLFETQEIELDPYPSLLPGGLVKVVRGPLKGSMGYLEQKKSKYRLVLALQVLKQAVSVEIDFADVEPVH